MESQLFQRLLKLEMEYLDDLIQLFKLYYEPLRKFSSMIKNEHRFIFSQMEPFLSFSCMIKGKLDGIIRTQDFTNSSNLSRLYSKPLLRSYAEYFKNLPQILILVKDQYLKDPEFLKLNMFRAMDNKPLLSCYLLRPVKQIRLYKETFAKVLKCRVVIPYAIELDYWDLYNLIKSLDRLMEGVDMCELEEFGKTSNLPHDIQMECIHSLFPHDDLEIKETPIVIGSPKNIQKFIDSNHSVENCGKILPTTKSQKRSKSTVGTNKAVKRLYSTTSTALKRSPRTNPTVPKKRHLAFNAKLDMVTRNKSKILTMPPPSYIENSFQSRTYVTEGYATISQGSHSAQRYLFLFNDWLIVAKSKSNNVFHLKKKVRVAEIWVMEYQKGLGDICQELEALSFIIGWPTVNSVITFGSTDIRKHWWENLERTIKSQCDKEEPKITTLKIFNWNLESPIKAKTMQINCNQPANECLENALKLFRVHPQQIHDRSQQPADLIRPEPEVSLWVQNQKEDGAIRLYGHERPYAIIMNHIRKVSGCVEGPNLPFCCRDDSTITDPSSTALSTMMKEAGLLLKDQHGSTEGIKGPEVRNKSHSTPIGARWDQNLLPFQYQQLLEGNLSTMCCQFSLRTAATMVTQSRMTSIAGGKASTNSNGYCQNNNSTGLESLKRSKKALGSTKSVSANFTTSTSASSTGVPGSKPSKKSPKLALSLNTWAHGFKWNTFQKSLNHRHHRHEDHSNGGSLNLPTISPKSLKSTSSYTKGPDEPVHCHNGNNFSHKISQIMSLGTGHHKTSCDNTIISQTPAASSTCEIDCTRVGEGRHLFGRLLRDVMLCQGQEFPKPIKKIIQLLYTYGPYTVGIFRKSASAKLCKNLREQLDQGVDIKLEDIPMLAIASVFKDFLRNIPNSIMDCNMYDEWSKLQNIENETEKFMRCKCLLNDLPSTNRMLLGHTLRIFKSIHDNSDYNNMTATNLGICVGQSLLRQPMVPSPTSINKLLTAAGGKQQHTFPFQGEWNTGGGHHHPAVNRPNLSTTSLIRDEGGTKMIPLLVEYMIINITKLIPSVAMISSSFKIKFNSSRQKKRPIRNLMTHTPEREEFQRSVGATSASTIDSEAQNEGRTVPNTYNTNRSNLDAKQEQFTSAALIKQNCLQSQQQKGQAVSFPYNLPFPPHTSSLSSPSSALSLPVTLSRLLSPSPNSDECLNGSRTKCNNKTVNQVIIPKLSINGTGIGRDGSSIFNEADSLLNDYFASDFGVSLSSLETKYDFNTGASRQGSDIKHGSKDHLSLREPSSLGGTSERSQSRTNSCSQSNSHGRLESLGDSDSLHSLQESKRDNYRRYDSSIDSLEMADKDDIYIYSKSSLYPGSHNYFSTGSPNRARVYSITGDGSTNVRDSERQPVPDDDSTKSFNRHHIACKNNTLILLNNGGSGERILKGSVPKVGNIVSPLTSSSRDSGLTMSDSNLYNTEPELDDDDDIDRTLLLSKRLSHDNSVNTKSALTPNNFLRRAKGSSLRVATPGEVGGLASTILSSTSPSCRTMPVSGGLTQLTRRRSLGFRSRRIPKIKLEIATHRTSTALCTDQHHRHVASRTTASTSSTECGVEDPNNSSLGSRSSFRDVLISSPSPSVSPVSSSSSSSETTMQKEVLQHLDRLQEAKVLKNVPDVVDRQGGIDLTTTPCKEPQHRKKSSTHAEISISYVSPWERVDSKNTSIIYVEDGAPNQNKKESSRDLVNPRMDLESSHTDRNHIYDIPDTSTYGKSSSDPSCSKRFDVRKRLSAPSSRAVPTGTTEGDEHLTVQSHKSFQARKIYENSLRMYLKEKKDTVNPTHVPDIIENANGTLGVDTIEHRLGPVIGLQNYKEPPSPDSVTRPPIMRSNAVNKSSKPSHDPLKTYNQKGPGVGEVTGTWSVSQLTQLFANMTPHPNSSSDNFLNVRQNASRLRSSASFYEKNLSHKDSGMAK